MATDAPRPIHIRIRPSRGWNVLDLQELWQYRELLWILAERDVRLRYKQTGLGIVWVVLQPLVASLIFAVIFGAFARMPSDGVPYLLFAFSGLLMWNLFSGALQRAGNSLIADAKLISKVYFPRMLIPIASVVAVIVDFFIALVVTLILMVGYGVWPTWRLALLPFFLFLNVVLSVGLSLWLSALNVRYRDFMYAAPFIIQVLMYATPVVYAASIVPEKWRLWFSLNPMVGIVEGSRWSLLGQSALTPEMVAFSIVISFLTLASGVYVFRRVERGFADTL